MTEIDERIVAMQFDNKNFEKHAKETIKTLEKLRENLDMEDAVDSLNGLTKASKDLNLDKAAESAEKLHRAFTGVQKIASKTFSVATFPISKLGRALGNLASDVKKWFGIDLARTLEQSATKAVKALTVEPVSAGWNEYEMKMDSVKTILAGTKKEFAELSDEEHLGKVKSVLEDLNHYADDTIYSFKDMTSNIGKFTNAGVKLDVAAKSMMGISNLAAQAGQGAQQASMAMYNFSQAMGLGYVELRDWRSIENANMATLEFKDSLIEVGLAMGTLKKDSRGVVKTAVKGEKQVEVTSEKLRDTLSKKWLTSDVLSKALEIYSGELSREEIKRLGNFTEEQIDHFMELGAEAKKSATEVRTFTKMFDALKEAAQSGWAMSFEYIIGDIDEATKLWTSINERISGWLNVSAENRNKILQEWRGQKTDETGRVWTISDHDGRQDLIDSLNSVLNIMENIGGAISKVAEDVFGKLDGRKLADFTQRIAGTLHEVDMWLGDIGDSTSRISKMSRILKLVLAPLKLLFRVTKEIGGAIVKFILPFVDPVLNFFATLGDLVLNLVDGKVSLGKFFDGIAQAAKAGWSQIKNVLFGNAGFNFNTGKALRDGPIAKFFAGIGETITTWVGKLQDGTAFEELGRWFTEKWNFIKDLILGPLVKDEATGKMVHSGPIGQLFDSLSDTIGAEIEKFKNNPIIKSITTTLGSIFDPIKEFFVGKDFGTKNGVKVRKLGGFEVMIQNIKKSLGMDSGKFDLSSIVTEWVGKVTTAWESVTSWFTQANTDVQNFIADVQGWEGWEKISEFFGGIWTTVSGWFTTTFSKDTWGQIVEWYNGVNEKVTEFINKVAGWSGWDNVSGFFNGVWNAIVTWWNDNKPNGETWANIKSWFNGVHETVTTFITNARGWSGWNVISEFFTNIWDAVTKWWNDHKPNEGTWKSIKLWFGEVHTKVTSFITKAGRWSGWSVIGNFFSNVWSQISDWWTNNKPDGDTWKSIKTWFTNVHSDVTGFIENVGTWANDVGLGKYFEDYIMTPIRTLFDFLFPKAAAEGAGTGEVWEGASALSNISDSIKKSWNDETKSEVEGTRDDMVKTFESVVGKPDEVFGKSDENGQTLFGRVMAWFSNLSTTVSTTWNDVWSTLQKVSADISSGITTVKDAFNEIVKWLVESPWDEWLATFNQKLTETGKALGVFNTGLNIGGLFTFLGGLGKESKGLGSLFKSIGNKGGFEFGFNFGEAGKGIGSFFTNIGEGVKSFLGTAGDKVKDKNFFKDIGKAVGTYKESATTSTQRIKAFADVMIEFAGAVAAMVWAINQLLDKIDELNKLPAKEKEKRLQDFKDIMTNLIGALGFTELMAVVQGATAKQKVSMFGSLAGFAVAIEGMVLAVKQIIDVVKGTSFEKVQQAIGILTELGVLVTAFHALSTADLSDVSGTHFIFGNGKKSGLIGFAVAIEGMILAVKQIIALKATKDQIDSAVLVITELTGLVTAFQLLSSMQFGEHSGLGNGKKSGLIGFTIAMAEMVSAVGKIAEITKDEKVDMAVVQGTIAELAGLITGFQVFKNITSVQIGDTFKSGGKSSGLIGFTIALASLVTEVQKLAQGDPTKLSRATTIIERLSTLVNTFVIEKNLGSFLSSDIVAGSFNYKGGSKSTGILGFVAAITALFAEVETIAHQDITKIQEAENVIQSLGDMILIFVGEKGLISLFNTGLNKIPGGSSTASEALSIVNMIAFVGAIGALLYGAAELSKMDSEQYDRCIGAIQMIKELVSVLTQEQFIGALGNLMGAISTKLSGSVGPGQAAMAALNGVIAVTVSLLGVLVQAAMFGGLYRLLGGDDFISVLQDGAKVASALGEFFSAFIGGITKSISKGAEAGKLEADAEVVVNLSEVLGDLDESDMDHLTMIVGKMKDLTQNLRGFDPTLFQTIFSGDISLGRFSDYMVQLGGGLRSFSDSVGSGFSSSAVQTGIELLTAFAEFGILAKDSDYFAVDELIDSLRLLGDQSEEIKNIFGDKSINWEGISGIFEGLGEAVGKGIINGIGQISTQSIVDAIRSNLSSDKFSSDSVQTMIEEWLFGNGQNDTLLGKVMAVGSDTIDQLSLTAEHAMDEAGNVANEYANNVGNALTNALEDIKNGGDYETVWNNVWSVVGDGSGLLGGISDVGTQTAEKVTDDIAKGLTGTRKILYDAGGNAGYYLDLGLANGILKNRSLPENAANMVGLSTAQSLRSSLRVESPSKVTEEIGMFLMKGLGIGITSNGNYALDAIYSQGSAYAEAMREALSPLDSALSDQFNFNPTITPVLDMSNIREGLGGINGMFSNRYAMNMTVPSFSRNTQVPNVQSAPTTNASYIAAIEDRIDQLNANIANLKIYLDTGVLVGSTVAAYDKALGARAARATRG